jgi:hypothetical protein
VVTRRNGGELSVKKVAQSGEMKSKTKLIHKKRLFLIADNSTGCASCQTGLAEHALVHSQKKSSYLFAFF